MDSIEMPKCLSCLSHINPIDRGVARFDCPECDKIKIVRCTICRTRGNSYICPNCGFKGPCAVKTTDIQGELQMAKMLTVIQIIPSSPELDIEDFVKSVVKEKLTVEAGVEFMGMRTPQPLAFGLYSVDVYIQVDDSEEGSKKVEAFEELLSGREDLQSVEITNQTLAAH